MITTEPVSVEAEVGPNSPPPAVYPVETPVPAIVTHHPPPPEPLTAEPVPVWGPPVEAAGRVWSGEWWGATVGYALAQDWASARVVAGIAGWPVEA